ncbi:immunoglobulin lambda-like polypeptide 5 isoform 1-T1 [Menidia menidia]
MTVGATNVFKTPIETLSNGSRFLYQSHSLCGGWDYLIFVSGTKLYVTEQPVVKPVVSVYPAASRGHLEGKSSLLCLASGMFPPLVRFSWKRQKKGSDGWEELSPDGEEQLELREPGPTASIRLLDPDPLHTYRYSCSVSHEEGPVEAQAEQELPAPEASCPPERDPADLLALQQAEASFQCECRVKLLCLLYTALVLKSLLSCCGLSLLMSLRNQGASTTCTHAD